MSKAHLRSLVLLVFAVTACGGDDSGESLTGAAPFVVIPSSGTLPTTPTPAPTPAVAHHTSSLLPVIDNSKIPSPEVGFSEARIKVNAPQDEKSTPSGDGIGAFRTSCTFSHMNYDDAIVFPGLKGASHLHAYFGNTGANYASTR